MGSVRRAGLLRIDDAVALVGGDVGDFQAVADLPVQVDVGRQFKIEGVLLADEVDGSAGSVDGDAGDGPFESGIITSRTLQLQ